MKEPRELEKYLKSTLFELNKLAEQIHATKDYSEKAEYLLCLRELVIEQMREIPNFENTSHTDHATR